MTKIPAQWRLGIILAFSAVLGASFSVLGIAPVWAALIALPLGPISWFWILFGDYHPFWHVFTGRGREAYGPVLMGNSNLGSRATQTMTLIGETIRVLQAIAIAYMMPILLGLAATRPATALLWFLVPMVIWWIASQVFVRSKA